MKLAYIKILFLYLTICYSNTIIAFNGNIRFRKFPIEGIPNKHIESVFQDHNGFIWFGIYDGIVKYDSKQLRVYKHSKNSKFAKSSLPIYNANVIIEDSEKNLWIGGLGGLTKYSDNCECFDTKLTELDSLDIRAIVEDNNHNFWIGTKKGLYIYNYKSNDFSKTDITDAILSLTINNNNLYIGTELEWLKVIDIYTLEPVYHFNKINNPQLSENSKSVFSIKFINNKCWFSTSSGGLFSFDEHKNLSKHTPVDKNKNEFNSIFFNFLFISKDIMLIATQYEGMLAYNIYTGETFQYTTTSQLKKPIVSNTVRNLFLDNENTVWVTTHQGGICYFNLADLAFDYQYFDNAKQNSLNYDVISSFEQTNDSTIWIASDGGGLHLYNIKEKSYNLFDTQKGLPSNAITDIVKDHQNNLWASLWYGGVVKINSETNQITQFYKDTESVYEYTSRNNIKGLFIDTQNRLWIFPLYSSIIIYDINRNETFSISNPGSYPVELFKTTAAIDAVEDYEGSIWIYGYQGLFKYSFDNIFYSFNSDNNHIGSLSSERLMNAFTDNSKYIWISTFEGLDRIEISTNTIENVSHTHNLPLIFYSILKDNNNDYWATTSLGFGKFNSDSLKFKIYDRNFDIDPDFYISRSAFKDNSGRLYFGSSKGYISFNPNEVVSNTTEPELFITKLYLFNEEVTIEKNKEILKAPINLTDTIILDFNQNMIEFEFASSSYINPVKNLFTYKLEGFNDNWYNLNYSNKVTFTNLNPGKYILRVKAANSEGLWGKEKHLHIIISPPWWKETWFQICILLSLCIILFGIYYYRIINLRRTNIKLGELVSKKTEELQNINILLQERNEEVIRQNEDLNEKNEEIISQREELYKQKQKLEKTNIELKELSKTKDKFFSIIAHDLKNPMNVLIGFSDLLINKKDLNEEKKEKYIQMINDASRSTYSLLVNLLDWARSQTNSVSMAFKKHQLYQLVDDALQINQAQAVNKKIDLKIDIPNNIYVYVDERTIHTVIRNLVSNAIKFTPENGKIEVYIDSIIGSKVIVSVKDNGIGIPADKIESIFDTSKKKSTKGTAGEEGTGLGLVLCYEFIKHNDGDIWVNSVEGEGSCFNFSIPLYDY